MWELRKTLSHGRISLRRFSLLVTTAVMALFVAIAIPPEAAFADGATRNGDTLTYGNNTYTHAAQNELPKDVVTKAPSTQGFRYVDTTNKKAYFILTSSDYKTATSGYYVVYDFTPPDNFSNPSPPADVTIADGATNTTGEKSGSDCDSSTLGGIGWIVCPTVNFLAKGMDKIYGIISSFLVVKTVTNDTSSSIYQLWSYVRDIANVCFVIAFLVIVYSQITQLGISNYGIKHTLPRLIIAAILVNASYWICAMAVDASNILGYSIHNLFVTLMNKYSVGGNYQGSIPTWEQVSAIALAGTAAVAGGIFIAANTISGTVYLMIPFLLGVIVAALVALVILAARQALITCLIIISPLAFVAFILPNTEKYFTKWREGMMTLLLLFPIFSVVFSGAQLAGMAIVQSAGGNLFTIILGMAVQVAPIAITPLLVKFSGGIIGKVAGIVNNPSKGLLDRTRNWSQGMAGERKNKVLSNRSRLNNLSPFKGASTKYLDDRRRYREQMRKSYESRAENRYAGTRRGQIAEAATRSAANDKQRVENAFANSARGRQLELQSRNLGVQKQEIENSLLRSGGGQQLTRRQQMAEIDKNRVNNEFEESALGHQVDRAKRVVEAEKKRIENTHQANWDNAVQTDANLKQLELSVKASEVHAALARGTLDKMHAEIAADGSKSEHVMNLRGQIDPGAYDGMLQIARNIKTESVQSSLAATAKGMAERKLSEVKTEALKDNVIKVDGGTDIYTIDGRTIVEYGAGVMGRKGQNAVLAKAKSEVSAALVDDIKNIQSTMDYALSTDNGALRKKFEQTDVLAEKIAYAKAMAKNGGPGIAEFRKLLTDIGDFNGTGHNGKALVDKDSMFDFKELLAAEGSIMSAGKDIEFFLTNSTFNDASGSPLKRPDGSLDYKTFRDLSTDVKTWGNLSATAFASQNAATQFYALEYLHGADHDKYMQIINSIRSNPAALGSLKQGVYERFSIYSDAQRRANPSLPAPGTLV